MRRLLAVAALFLAAAIGRSQTQPAISATDAAVAANSGSPINVVTISGTAPTDGQVPQWSAATQAWIAATVTGGGSTPTGTGFTHITGGVQDGASKTVDVSSADITGILACADFPALTGDVTTSSGSCATAIGANKVVTNTINSAAVTYAKIQNETNATLLGNSSGGTAAPSEQTVSAPLTYSSGALGVAVTTTNDGGAIVKQSASPGTQQGSGGNANINHNGQIISETDALATTPTGGHTLQNTTPAANGAQQVSPPTTYCGQGWGTTGSTNEKDCFRLYTLPVQGTTSTSTFKMDASLAGGAYANAFSMTNAGSVTFAGAVTASTGVTCTGGSCLFSLTGGMGAGVGGVSELTGQGGTILQTGQSQLISGLSGATGTSTGTMLPAGSVIIAVAYRITTTITGATGFQIGDGTTATRFCGTQSTLTAGTTGVCLGAPASAQAANANIVITSTGSNFTAGAIRVQAYYFLITPPTS